MATSFYRHSDTRTTANVRADLRLQEPQRPLPPNFLATVKQEYVKLVYQYLLTLCLLTLITVIAVHLCQLNKVDLQVQYNQLAIVAFSGAVVLGFTLYLIITRPKTVYLVDYSCYRPPNNRKMKLALLKDRLKQYGGFSESAVEFQNKIIDRSGLGDETYVPAAFHCMPPAPSTQAAIKEAEEAMFGALENLFQSTVVHMLDIGIMVVNCGIFNPIPSMSSMMVNKYKLRENIKIFNLSGMGCSAGLIAIDLAKDMLRVHPNTYALVISTEVTTYKWYTGNEKSMLIPVCLFRVGGAAVLLSNKSTDKTHAKYKLLHLVRTHRGSDDDSYNCIRYKEDDAGKSGPALSKGLITVAGGALKSNITTLGPLVLPYGQQLLFLANLIARKLTKSKIKPYIPDFKLAFHHLCIHAGGKAVIEELEKKLQLSDEDVEASRMTLYRFGNTSSSSIWIELAYTEAKGRVKKRNRVWQIAFGSGFKCNNVAWEAIRDVKRSDCNVWADCIDNFPVDMKVANV